MSEDLKMIAAEAAIEFLPQESVIGVGTGSTVNCFIECLKNHKAKIDGAVPSSVETEKRLKDIGIPIVHLNSVSQLSLYVDGADEVNDYGQCIKGGGGALTREKIVRAAAKQFICIVDESKVVKVLGKNHPLPIEVIEFSRSFVARELVKLGGDPEYREGFTTDNGNVILDIFNLKITDPIALEEKINHIPGVVANGLFAKLPASHVLVGTRKGVRKLI